MKRYFSIELLRFLTSLSVLLYHYRHFYYPLNFLSTNEYKNFKSELPFFNYIEVLYTYGFYGVHVFYTISGFVFAHVYLSISKDTTFKEFSVNRIGRLYPLHFATLLFVAALQLIYFFNYNNFQFGLINDFYHFILQVFFISSWGFESAHSFNGPIWSVSVEMGIYILFFILIKYLQNYNLIFTILISIIFIIIDKLQIYQGLFLECARLFFSGVLVFFIFNKLKNKKYIFLIASLILLIFSFIGNFKTFIFCPSLVLFTICFEQYLKIDKINMAFSKLGNLTYALYLLHVPFQLLIIILTKNIFNNFIIFNTYFFFILYFISLFSLAHLTFTLYEKPANASIRKSLLNA